MDKLMSCPFCGGEPEVLGDTTTIIRCSNDQCVSRIDWGGFNFYDHRNSAIAAWNTRTPAATVVGWRAIAEAPVGVSIICYHKMLGRFLGFQNYITEGCADTVWGNWNGDTGIVPPTHWQPLPAPPARDG